MTSPTSANPAPRLPVYTVARTCRECGTTFESSTLLPPDKRPTPFMGLCERCARDEESRLAVVTRHPSQLDRHSTPFVGDLVPPRLVGGR